MEEKGIVGNSFVKQIKFIPVTGLGSCKRGKEQLDAEGIKQWEEEILISNWILGDTCAQMIQFLSTPALCCIGYGWLLYSSRDSFH